MKALVVRGEWSPKKEYKLTEEELSEKRASNGGMVWKNPVFAFEDIPVPEVGNGEVLIRVKRCGICGTDTHLYETSPEGYIIFSGPVKLPCVIGHEYSGVIEKIGRGVTSLKVGDMVAVESVLWCGRCSPCRSGAVNQCEHVELAGVTSNGALAEFVLAKEWHCWKINSFAEAFTEDEAFDLGTLIEPIGCAYNGMFVAGGGVKPGAYVTVYGAGPIGLAAVAMARLSGAAKIIVFDIVPERLEIARWLGADHGFELATLERAGKSTGEVTMELTGGVGAHMQIEAAGAAARTIPEMEKCLAPGGRIIYLGRVASETPIRLNVFVTNAAGIIGSRGHAGYGIFDNIIRLIAASRLDVRSVITKYYQFDQAVEAVKKSADRRDGKIIVRVG